MKSEKENNSKDKEKDKDNKSEKENPKEPTQENKTEEENIFLDFLKNAFMNERLNKEEESDKEKEKEKTNESKTIKTLSNLNNTESGFLSSSINKLKTGDDMDIMSELLLLSEQLSLSSDQIGDNPNLAKLLEEICKNLEKLYLPEIIIYSLQCINYILDINPGLTSVLKRVGAIPKL